MSILLQETGLVLQWKITCYNLSCFTFQGRRKDFCIVLRIHAATSRKSTNKHGVSNALCIEGTSSVVEKRSSKVSRQSQAVHCLMCGSAPWHHFRGDRCQQESSWRGVPVTRVGSLEPILALLLWIRCFEPLTIITSTVFYNDIIIIVRSYSDH